MKRQTSFIISIICILYIGGCGFREDEGMSEASGADIPEVDSAPTTEVFGGYVTPSQYASEAEKPQSSSDVTLVMAGDILLHDRIEQVAKDSDGNYNYKFIFENMKPEIEKADIAIVNQEVIIGGQELGISGYPEFNAPYEVGDALVETGFDVVCHATNHALDKGKSGVVNCYEFWKQRYPQISVLGINRTERDYEDIDIIEKNGIKIAFLNYTYGTNGISFPKDMPHAIDMLDEEKVVKDLKNAEENADFTVVCPHWGTEYNHGVDKYQKKWTELFRENGADLVIGAHPHVIEPIEMIEDENAEITNNHGGGDMLVYYSIGNFVSWTSSTGSGVADRSVGGMAKVTLTRNSDGEVIIKDNSVRALVCHNHSEEHGVTVYPLSEYSEDFANENEIRLNDSSFSRQYCIDLCNRIWGESWE